jgi:predicted NBD/HSP70 family sugar kinase
MTAAKMDDAARARALDTANLLQLIWQERSISRTEIARRTGLGRTVLAEIVGDLLATEMVRESSAGTSLLSFRDDAFVIVGVELSVAYLHVVVTDLRGCVRASRQRVHPVTENPDGTLRLMQKLIGSCLEEVHVPSTRLLGIGVAVPAPVDPAAPERMHPNVMPKWQGVNPVEVLHDAFGCPVMLENDANLGALAERWWGAGIGGEDLAFIQLEAGVGAGLIISGKLHRGMSGTAGEMGHIVIDPRGPRCICGLSGCLGAVIGTAQLLARAEALLKEGRPSRLSRHGLSVRALVDAAHVRDPVASQVVGEVGQCLGIAVASLISLLNPGVVVLGGPLAAAGDLLLAPIRDTLRQRTLWKPISEARIVTSLLGETVIAVGAATKILEDALANPVRQKRRVRA